MRDKAKAHALDAQLIGLHGEHVRVVRGADVVHHRHLGTLVLPLLLFVPFHAEFTPRNGKRAELGKLIQAPAHAENKVLTKKQASGKAISLIILYLLWRNTGKTALVFAGKRSVILQPRILASIITLASFTRHLQRREKPPRIWEIIYVIAGRAT
ncbi:hypothetical protein [Prosthecobacter sp.]|uniref:hypothetical protein n=1 Tax=Prosthecobacter sp. TaxID=1965333 RepID=UPI002487D427|nr:hypothetical protein [Prosthecobacter sp.]MDI1314142.1 hypothetical protein [Prosthecobacter sp.]